MTDILGTIEVMRLGGGRWELTSNPIYLLDSGRSEKPLAGFICDFGSIPRAFWSLLGLTPLGSDGDRAFLLHDWLYYQSRNGSTAWTREDADKAMLEVLHYDGVDPLIAYGVYSAVRGAAWKAWGAGQYDGMDPFEDPEGFEWFRD